MQYGLHRHRFGGITTFNHGHIHRYCGRTSLAPNYFRHVHYIAGITTFNDGHVHRYAIETGPSIPIDGGHIHRYRVATSFENGHIHYICGYTDLEY
jgi:hypothetical protein